MSRRANRAGRETKAAASGRHVAWLFACLAAIALVTVGCGDSGDGPETTDISDPDSTTIDTAAPNFTQDSEVDAQEEGTPGRALLEWWQAFQFADAQGVLALTSQDVIDEIGEEEITELVEERGAGFQGIELFTAVEDGDEASVRGALLNFEAEEGEPPPEKPTGATPTTISMLKVDDEWRFDDAFFLEPLVEAQKLAQKEARKAEKKGQPAEEQPAEEQGN
jgi:hypothetical protein